MISQTETENTSQKDRTSMDSSNDIKLLKKTTSRKKLNLNKKVHENPKYSSYSSSSVATSFVKRSMNEGEPLFLKSPNETGNVKYFKEKYLSRGSHEDELLP